MSSPTPVNQFNRLIHVSGTEPTGTYALGSRWNNIHDGQNWDGRNCTAAMGALSVAASTGGRVNPTPPMIRNNQYDWAGGIGLDDVNVAIRRLYPNKGYELELPQSADWADVIQALKNNRFVVIQYDYDAVPWEYQVQKGGTFDHAGGLGKYYPSDGSVLAYDPLGKNARRVPQRAYRAAAEKLALAQRGTRSRLFVGFTDPMPPPYVPDVTYRYGGQPRGRGRYLARRDNVPIRSRPEAGAPQVFTLDHREDFACRQTVGSGDKVWCGTADGTRWVYRQVMWYAGGITGKEVVR